MAIIELDIIFATPPKKPNIDDGKVYIVANCFNIFPIKVYCEVISNGLLVSRSYCAFSAITVSCANLYATYLSYVASEPPPCKWLFPIYMLAPDTKAFPKSSPAKSDIKSLAKILTANGIIIFMANVAPKPIATETPADVPACPKASTIHPMPKEATQEAIAIISITISAAAAANFATEHAANEVKEFPKYPKMLSILDPILKFCTLTSLTSIGFPVYSDTIPTDCMAVLPSLPSTTSSSTSKLSLLSKIDSSFVVFCITVVAFGVTNPSANTLIGESTPSPLLTLSTASRNPVVT